MVMPAVAPAVAGPAAASPLSSAYARLTEVLPALRVRETGPGGELPGGPEWVRGARLAQGGPALESFLAREEAEAVGVYGRTPRPDVTATFALHRYTWPVCLLVTVPWFLLRRVPRVPVEAVALRRAGGEVAVRVEEFACLPDDEAAREPGARVVPDEEALRAEVRAATAEHLTPLLDGFGPAVRRGPRALWGLATDDITEGLWYLGHLLGEEERAKREAGLLLPGGTLPYARSAGFRVLDGPDGEPLATRDRASCCLYYTLRPEDTCVTCPRTCDAERVARLSPAH
ncbi:(2Fe-2S)-binding protein [Streptomyces nanshensis]|uniref:Iron-sulfur protein n=1 Tax=Streptomyces nanshensis TaxID=518642 RepID=A0A1E7L5T5_9ACTN|nr:(2Fe-2S)-binding protein [Streptomyces nanshensis]OEV11373.1 iron-sulfur protein [Streptomyces nanshensis]